MKSTSKTTNTPKLRFPEFTGDWECRKLGEVVEKVKSYSLSRNVETEEFTGFKYIHYGDIHRGVANIIHSDEILPDIQTGNFELLKHGDLVLADASEDYEGVGACCVIDCFSKNNLVAGLHTIAIRPIKTDHLFLYYLLNTQTFKRYGRFVGTGTKVVAISPTNLLKFKTNIPTNPSEQTTIGNFFRQIDKFIALHQGQLDKVKTLKKGLLQKMFPAQGETVPQIRFPQFTDAWEQCKLGDLLVERNTQIEESEEYPLMSFVQGVGVTPKSERYDRSFLVKDNTKKYKMTCLGDFIYSSNNLETGSIGFNRTGKAVISPVYSIFRSKKELESQFIGILSTRKDFIYNMVRFRQGVVYGQWKIPEKDFLTIQIFMPNDDEQRKIIQLFRQVDELITLHQRKLAHLKTLKKALLQQMFV
ncbi:MAG: restriction endonuclease subunit S [Moraxella sp.]|nr:restriction endonuclease subunit S [Moraxella sp.]